MGVVNLFLIRITSINLIQFYFSACLKQTEDNVKSVERAKKGVTVNWENFVVKIFS